jgi:hypothetical protein
MAFSLTTPSNYVTVPASASLDVGQGSGITIETWIFLADTLTHPVVDWSPSFFGVHLWIGSDASFYANFADVTGAIHVISSAPGVITAGTFLHLATTYDKASGNAELFLNGTTVTQVNLGTFTPQTSTDLNIGYRSPAAPYGGSISTFNGLIDELAIYDQALSAPDIQAIYSAGTSGKCIGPIPPYIASEPTNQTLTAGDNAVFSVIAGGAGPLSYQWSINGTNLLGATKATLLVYNVQPANAGNYAVAITNLYGATNSDPAVLTVTPAPACTNPPPSLISWWRGDQIPNDSVGGNDLTLYNGAGFAPGFVGHAFSFNGTNQYAQTANTPSLNPTAGLTIEGWVYATALPGASMDIVSKDDESLNRQYLLAMATSSQGPVLRAGVGAQTGFVVVNGTNVVQTNAWNHVAMTYDGSMLRLYVNGNADATAAPTGAVRTTTQPLRIGRGASALYFNGYVDEVSLYGRGLSSAEIQAVYNSGAGGKCRVPIAPFFVSQPTPTNQSVTIGSNATFSAAAAGSVPLSYQWRFNGSNILGATSSTLVLTNVQIRQAGFYSVSVTNSTGSVLGSNAQLIVVYPAAAISITSTSAVAGRQASVPIMLVANGNENAIGFSLNFDTNKLTYAGASLGTGATGAVLMINTSQTNAGRVGLAVALPPSAAFALGTQQLVRVSFAVIVATNATSSTISFGDAPIQRQLLDNQFNSLAATYASGTISITPADFEGDIYPRPGGDKVVNLTDWLQMGRYVARLDYPTNAAEFQRADCAPRSTLGDGAIKVSDWVQAGRYAFGLDPLTLVGGPTNEIAGPGAGPSATRVVTAGAATLSANQPFSVSISLAAQGNENALGFSLTFDPARAVFSSASLGADGSGADLYVNANQAASGQLGFALALGAGNSFAAGTRELIKLNFQAAPAASGSFSPTFSDQPVPREVSDAAANALPASYVSGSIVSNPAPTLSITRAGTNIVLTWPLSATNFNLQEAVGTFLSNAPWSNLMVAPLMTNNQNIVTLPRSPTNKFYRLHSP